MAPITKLMLQEEEFQWTFECQDAFENIKSPCMNAPILIVPHWDLEF